MKIGLKTLSCLELRRALI